MANYSKDDIRNQFEKETKKVAVFANREPYVSYINWLEAKILNKINNGK